MSDVWDPVSPGHFGATPARPQWSVAQAWPLVPSQVKVCPGIGARVRDWGLENGAGPTHATLRIALTAASAAITSAMTVVSAAWQDARSAVSALPARFVTSGTLTIAGCPSGVHASLLCPAFCTWAGCKKARRGNGHLAGGRIDLGIDLHGRHEDCVDGERRRILVRNRHFFISREMVKLLVVFLQSRGLEHLGFSNPRDMNTNPTARFAAGPGRLDRELVGHGVLDLLRPLHGKDFPVGVDAFAARSGRCIGDVEGKLRPRQKRGNDLWQVCVVRIVHDAEGDFRLFQRPAEELPAAAATRRFGLALLHAQFHVADDGQFGGRLRPCGSEEELASSKTRMGVAVIS